MNELNGSVALMALPDLLHYLSTNGKAGVLTVNQGRMHKSLYLAPKGMRLLSTAPRKIPSLVEILIRTRKFTRAQLEMLAAEQKRTGKRLGELVSRHSMVTKAEVDSALREQAQEEIYDLFLWSEAKFEFKEGPEPPKPKDFPLADVIVDASPTSVMLEAARRADELAVIRKVVGDESMVPVRTAKPFAADKLGLDPDLLSSVYGHIDGRAEVAEVVRLSHYPRFEALRAIYMLATEYGHVEFGRGTARFRAQKAEEPAAPAPETPRAEPRRTILLLSDMAKYRQTLAAMIREANYLVLEETSDKAAALFAEHRKVDAIVLDVGLATRDEYQFVSWLASLEVPVIVLSDDASSESAQAAVRKGASGYLAKPFARDSIIRSLSAIVPP